MNYSCGFHGRLVSQCYYFSPDLIIPFQEFSRNACPNFYWVLRIGLVQSRHTCVFIITEVPAGTVGLEEIYDSRNEEEWYFLCLTC